MFSSQSCSMCERSYFVRATLGSAQFQITLTGLVQNSGGAAEVDGRNEQFDSAEKVGNKPIHADHIVIGEEALHA
jgi:hypothetical protein